MIALLFPTLARAACPGYSACPSTAYLAPIPAHLAQIDAAESAAIARFHTKQIFPSLVGNLGEILFFDKNLSVNRNEACAFCHTPSAGFHGDLGAQKTVGNVFPGSLPARLGFRVPQAAAYAAFAPVLSYDSKSQNFYGGNFWDGRATGKEHGYSPAVQQAMEPFTNPLEMALADQACVLRRISQGQYSTEYRQMWGRGVFNFAWPAGIDQLCQQPAATPGNPAIVFAPLDHIKITLAFQQLATTIVTYEVSLKVSSFSSKFDAWLSGKAQLTTLEKQGYELFIGKAGCAACHFAAGPRPLFTNFSYARLDLPKPAINVYLDEDQKDADGYIANPLGHHFVDRGLGGVLAKSANREWRAQATKFEGAFMVPGLRNVTAEAAPVYMHDGSFSNLTDVVHFFNVVGISSDTAKRSGAKAGALGLSADDESAILAFLTTLRDGFYQPGLLPKY